MEWKNDLQEAKELFDDEFIDNNEYQEMKNEALEKRQHSSMDWKQELKEAKELFDEGLINENDYKNLKKLALSKRQKGDSTSTTPPSTTTPSTTSSSTTPPSINPQSIQTTPPIQEPSISQPPPASATSNQNISPLGSTSKEENVVSATSSTNPLASHTGTMVDTSNVFSNPPMQEQINPLSSQQTVIGHVVGTRIGKYEIIDILGEGGMGKVYKGRHHNEEFARQGGDVAIKVMRPDLAQSPDFRRRFLREAGTWSEQTT